MDGNMRANIRPGIKVRIVLKKDQITGVLTEGIVEDILTNSANHPHGIKVRLESGVGWTPLSRHIFQKISVIDFIYKASQA